MKILEQVTYITTKLKPHFSEYIGEDEVASFEIQLDELISQCQSDPTIPRAVIIDAFQPYPELRKWIKTALPDPNQEIRWGENLGGDAGPGIKGKRFVCPKYEECGFDWEPFDSSWPIPKCPKHGCELDPVEEK